jgi:hypothetical protein
MYEQFQLILYSFKEIGVLNVTFPGLPKPTLSPMGRMVRLEAKLAV